MNLDFVMKTRTGRRTTSPKVLSERLDFLRSRLNAKSDAHIQALIRRINEALEERRLTRVHRDSPPEGRCTDNEPIPAAVYCARPPTSEKFFYRVDPPKSTVWPSSW